MTERCVDRENITTEESIKIYSDALDNAKALKRGMTRDEYFEFKESKDVIRSVVSDLIYFSNLMLIATKRLGEIEDAQYLNSKFYKLTMTNGDKIKFNLSDENIEDLMRSKAIVSCFQLGKGATFINFKYVVCAEDITAKVMRKLDNDK